MPLGDLLVEVLAWAALGTWWAKYPRGIMIRASVGDDAIYAFLMAVPPYTYWKIVEEHRRRMAVIMATYEPKRPT